MRVFGGRFRIKERAPGRSVLSLFWWDLASFICELYMRLFHRLRLFGVSRIPDSGPLILISNHQSYFDPIVNSIHASRRPFTAIAGSHLVKFKPFGLLLKSWGTVFVSASAGDKGALKAAVEELKKTNNPSAIGVLVVHNKLKPKKGVLPPEITYIAGEDVPNAWNCYPWDAEAYGRDIFAHEALARSCAGEWSERTKICAAAAAGAAAVLALLMLRRK